MAVGTRNLATSYAHGSPKKQGRNASGQGAEEHSEVFARRVADCCRVLRMGHIDGHMGVIDGEAYGTYIRKCERRRWINSAKGKEK